jgi:hypothetical protein
LKDVDICASIDKELKEVLQKQKLKNQSDLLLWEPIAEELNAKYGDQQLYNIPLHVSFLL